MKTQISRNSHQPDKGYNGVYQQQGRMLTDADWNELTDIQKVRLAAALSDAIASGAPRKQGLAINPDGSIQPGVLYVDGWPARLAGNSPIQAISQPDLPRPPAFSGKNLRLYADVWERAVTALEDDGLLDPALHGADTCSRMRTMLQVKWCNVSKNPENPVHNPPIGTAELQLRLRKISVEDDPCDPCATELELDQRVGNYLFRVEVHDLYRKGGKLFLVVKWSRDNGSEQYRTQPADELPAGFSSGDWVWEFFDLETEKLLGRHFPQNYKPRRGQLVESFAVPGGSLPKDFVRQWDGYCTINLTENLLVEGFDRGVKLDPSLGNQAHGHIDLSGGSFKANLELIELELSLAGMHFLAGDYWQAEVREAVNVSGDYVLGTASKGETPAGIFHHYLELGQLDSTGALVPLTDAELRRFNFPPLTDIRAADVGLTNNCPGLYGSAANVQQALDSLCAIGAEDIAYQPSNCPESVRQLLQSTLSTWPDLDGDGKVSVKDMLDALLCDLNAGTLPYEVSGCGDDASPTVRSLLELAPGSGTTADSLDALLCSLNAGAIPLDKESPLCAALDSSDVRTVQDALQRLCLKSGGGGCAVSVEPGELQAQLEAFAGSDIPSIWLCLKPGEHAIDADLVISEKQSVKITGAGEQASLVLLNSGLWSMEALEIHIEDLGVVLGKPHGQLALAADVITARHNRFSRSGAAPGAPPMVQTMGRGRSAGQLHWSDNRMTSSWRRLASGAKVDDIAPAGVVGASINDRLKALVDDDKLMRDPAAYMEAVEVMAKEVVALPNTKKKAWRRSGNQALTEVDYSRVRPMTEVRADRTPFHVEIRPEVRETAPAPTVAPKARAKAAMRAITEQDVTVEVAAEHIGVLVAQIMEAGFNPVLALASHKLGGRLEGNLLNGDVWLQNDVGKPVDPTSQAIAKVSVEGRLVTTGDDLHLSGNEIQRLVSNMASGKVVSGVLKQSVEGYRVLTVSDNLFLDGNQSFIAGQLSFQGNHFPAVEPEELLGLVLSNRSTFVANVAGDESSRIQCAATALTESANLLTLQAL